MWTRNGASAILDIDVSSYADLHISWWWRTYGTNTWESSDDSIVEYCVGSGCSDWATLWMSPDEDNSYEKHTVPLPAEADNHAYLRLRFRTVSNNNDEYTYWDDISVFSLSAATLPYMEIL